MYTVVHLQIQSVFTGGKQPRVHSLFYQGIIEFIIPWFCLLQIYVLLLLLLSIIVCNVIYN